LNGIASSSQPAENGLRRLKQEAAGEDDRGVRAINRKGYEGKLDSRLSLVVAAGNS
jgi:hypothetical protein